MNLIAARDIWDRTKAGTRFSLPEEDAAVLIAAGMATADDDQSTPSPSAALEPPAFGIGRRRSEGRPAAEGKTAEDKPAAAAKRRTGAGRYQRRDMEAETAPEGTEPPGTSGE